MVLTLLRAVALAAPTILSSGSRVMPGLSVVPAAGSLEPNRSGRIAARWACNIRQTLVIRALGDCAPFVYRLGRQVFNLERGVRFP